MTLTIIAQEVVNKKQKELTSLEKRAQQLRDEIANAYRKKRYSCKTS